MVVLEIILYLLAGSLVLYLTNRNGHPGWKKAVWTILLWPFVLLHKYVKMIDHAKKNNRKYK